MLINLGEYEPFYGPQNAFHRCAIGLNFLSFFIEHPVYTDIFLKNTDLNEAVTLDGADSTVFVTREGNFTQAGIEFVDETEIFEGRDNKITMVQTYSKSFHCSYLLHSFPFDTQVFFLLSPFSMSLIPPGRLVQPGGSLISIRLMIIFILSAFILLNWYAELIHEIVSCCSGNTVIKPIVLFKKRNLWMIKIHVDEMNIFFLLRHLFWFTWQDSRISWTCATGKEQCKVRHSIK